MTRILAWLFAASVPLLAIGPADGAVQDAPVQAVIENPHARVPATCLDRRATIIGKPGKPLRGTRRADVIVTNGASAVNALGGGDRICLTGRPQRTVHVISAGAGEDQVVNMTGLPSAVSLGSGSNNFRGGPTRDEVSVASSNGVDVVRLGPGPDQIDGFVSRTRTLRLAGGTGSDELSINTVPASGRVMVNNAARRLEVGARRYPMTGFESFLIGGRSGATPSFMGSAGNEQVQIADTVGTVTTGPGNDRVTFSPDYLQDVGALRGGTGTDTYSLDTVDFGASQSVDLAAGVASIKYFAGNPRTVRFPLGGFDNFHLGAYTIDAIGDGDSNIFNLYTCRGTTNGGGGNDVIAVKTVQVDDFADCPEGWTVAIRGGAGNDSLTGGELDDTLIGDGGTDTADGADGNDTCQAESTLNCENTGVRVG